MTTQEETKTALTFFTEAIKNNTNWILRPVEVSVSKDATNNVYLSANYELLIRDDRGFVSYVLPPNEFQNLANAFLELQTLTHATAAIIDNYYNKPEPKKTNEKNNKEV